MFGLMAKEKNIKGWISAAQANRLFIEACGKSYLEIGSYCGLSANITAIGAKEVYCIDTFKATSNGQTQENEFTTLDIFKENTKQFSNIKIFPKRSVIQISQLYPFSFTYFFANS